MIIGIICILLLTSCREDNNPEVLTDDVVSQDGTYVIDKNILPDSILVVDTSSMFAWDDVDPQSDTAIFSEFLVSSKIKEIIVWIHTDATFAGSEFRDDVHLTNFFLAPVPKGRGWNKVGYWWWINQLGAVYPLNKANIDDIIEYHEITNGVAGWNSVSMHIAYSSSIPRKGPYDADTRTKEQKQSTINMLRIIKSAVGSIEVKGHRDVYGDKSKWQKTCPNFDVKDWLKSEGYDTKMNKV